MAGLVIGLILFIIGLDFLGSHLSSRYGAESAKPVSQPEAHTPVTHSLSQAEQRKRDDDLINSEAAGTIREQYATTVENQMLEQGYDMTVRATGARKSVLRFQWVKMSRPVIYGFINNKEVVNTLKAMGFKILIFTDGFDSTWQYEVSKL
jgi:hypothetical protein